MKVNNKEEFDKLNVFGLGDANTAFTEYFIGNSYLKPLTHPGEYAVFLANVTFEPGCRKMEYGISLCIQCIQLKKMSIWNSIHK